MSRGDVEPVPSVIEQSAPPWGSVSPGMPMSSAARAMFGGPTSRASWPKITLIDSAVASYRSLYPESPAPSALNGFQPLHSSDRSIGEAELYSRDGGMPSRNAATSVNGLNAEPVWRRPRP